MSNYNKYEPELKETVLRLYLEKGRTKKSLTEEYHLGQGTITYWFSNDARNTNQIHKIRNKPTHMKKIKSYVESLLKRIRKSHS